MPDFETLWKTEQELHAAWEKRAYEAEAALTDLRAERDAVWHPTAERDALRAALAEARARLPLPPPPSAEAGK